MAHHNFLYQFGCLFNFQFWFGWLFINTAMFGCLSIWSFSNYVYQFITTAIVWPFINIIIPILFTSLSLLLYVSGWLVSHIAISICLISLVVDPCMVGSVVVTASFVGIASFLSLPHLVTASGLSHCPTPRPPLFCRSMLHCSWAVLLLLFCCFCFLLHALCPIPIPLPPLFCLFANAHASVCSIWWSMLYAPCRSILCWLCL